MYIKKKKYYDMIQPETVHHKVVLQLRERGKRM